MAERLFVVRSLEESGIVTRCELTTYEPDGLLDLAFPDDERVVRLIMKVRYPSSPFLSIVSDQLKLTPALSAPLRPFRSPNGFATPSSNFLPLPKSSPSPSPLHISFPTLADSKGGISGKGGKTRWASR
jgi:hypothetical protein